MSEGFLIDGKMRIYAVESTYHGFVAALASCLPDDPGAWPGRPVQLAVARAQETRTCPQRLASDCARHSGQWDPAEP